MSVREKSRIVTYVYKCDVCGKETDHTSKEGTLKLPKGWNEEWAPLDVDFFGKDVCESCSEVRNMTKDNFLNMICHLITAKDYNLPIIKSIKLDLKRRLTGDKI